MDSYVPRANIDHFFSVLTTQHLSDGNRDTIMKLMIAEEDKLGRDLEHLQFAEDRVARSRDRVNYLRKLRDAFADGSTERVQADKMLGNFETIHRLMEEFCHRMRTKVNSSRI